MKTQNVIYGIMLALILVCGITAFPAVSSAVVLSNEASQKIREQIYVKTQNMAYTNDEGEELNVSISSNSDDSRLLMYVNLYGDRQYALMHRAADGSYEVKDGTLSEDDAVKIAEIASSSDEWRAM